VTLTAAIPDVLNRVEFGRIRGQFQQINVCWRFERIATVPARTVDHHDDVLLGVVYRDFVQEKLHAFGIDVRQDQTIELASTDVHRTIGKPILNLQCMKLPK